MKPYLEADDELLRQRFLSLQSIDDVAQLLEVRVDFLQMLLYGKRERQKYVEIKISKANGGERRICKPPRNLKILQQKLLRVLALVFTPRSCVTGFVKGRSILDNARNHCARRYVISFDLEDFFPTIHIGRVIGLLSAPPYSIGSGAAKVLGQIACHDDGHLPQGAPTSPIISNMICSGLDSELLRLAKSHRCVYSRYADDLCISTTRRDAPKALARRDPDGKWHLGAELVDVVMRHGFLIRAEKTRVRDVLRRQTATGITVNEFPNINREFIRKVRALIHDCNTRGPVPAAKKYGAATGTDTSNKPVDWICRVVEGKLAYLKMVRGESDFVVRALFRQASRIPGIRIKSPCPIHELKSQPIRRRARRNPNWSLWAERYHHAVYLLRCGLEPDVFNASAFRVRCGTIVTAGHNAKVPATGGGCQDGFLRLSIPLEEEIGLTGVYGICGQNGGVDLARGRVHFPHDWPVAWIPTQERIAEAGEEVAALGYPTLSFRHSNLVMHVGRIESVTRTYSNAVCYSLSFPSGPALSGGPLIDANGYCIGVMIENAFLGVAQGDGAGLALHKPYGQAIAIGHWRDIPTAR